ncbi:MULTISPECIES: hypothetical protein [Streptomyces]|uniref:hypothetical protein n=1 Tax=Streptomyces TaxID=1883 RepID=UPI00211A63E3|nr:hypothetical protein [Streptomyces scabiei]MDX3116392.1 hypothetical protein [Streptomyces scabiei]
MHRTTTTATLLVTVAISALSGCVTVQRPPVPGPAAAPSEPSVPRPDGRAATQIVQAPVREALEMVEPSRKKERRKAAQRPRTAEEQPAGQPPSSGAPPQARPPHPQPRRPAQPRVDLQDVEDAVRGNADVCALGRKYGGWRGNSTEAAICERAEQAYGR